MSNDYNTYSVISAEIDRSVYIYTYMKNWLTRSRVYKKKKKQAIKAVLN